MLKHVLIAAVALSVICESQLLAHNQPISEMMLVADDDYLHMEIVLNATELTFFRELDRDHNGHVNLAEVADLDEQVSRRIVDCFEIRVDGHIVEADVVGLVPNHNTHHLTVRAHYPVDATESSVELTSHLAAITHGAHLVHVVYRTPLEDQKARLSSTAASILFPAPQSRHSNSLGDVKREATPNSPGTRPMLQRIGVSVGAFLLLGGIYLFYKKNH